MKWPITINNVVFFPIVIVRGRVRREVARALERVPGKTPVLVDPEGLDAARYASVNKRVLGFLLRRGSEKLVDRSTRRLFRERGWGIIVVSLRYAVEDSSSLGVWRYYYLAFRRAQAYRVDLALASMARRLEEVWHPESSTSMAVLAGSSRELAIPWVSSSLPRALEKAYNLVLAPTSAR